jgi:hypothetical protein
VGNTAPRAAAACAAWRKASGVHASTNLRAVRLLCGPELIQNSLGAPNLRERRRIDIVSVLRISSSTARISSEWR